jgi:hypothetical protein
MGTLSDFIRLVEDCRPLLAEEDGLDRLVQEVRRRTGGVGFLDDYALVHAEFAAGEG